MQARTPFASHSWEPRFAVEHHEEAALAPAIALWRLGNYSRPWDFDDGIRSVARLPTAIFIGHPRWDSSVRPPYVTLDAPIAIDDLPRAIMTWLADVTYPTEPNFDGGEGRGFTVYWVYAACKEADSAAGGSLVVLPKWIEIHK